MTPGAMEERESTCRRCLQPYKRSHNPDTACRFHPQLFVCRKHDDQKRYYELKEGDPEYAAKFYDCCGAEDVRAPGCQLGRHLGWDD